jgi:TPR repeat protein
MRGKTLPDLSCKEPKNRDRQETKEWQAWPCAIVLVIVRIPMHKHWKQFGHILVLTSTMILAVVLALFPTPLQAQVPPKGIDPTLLAKANAGNADAQFNLGAHYANGQGVMQDYAQAAVWYQKAGDQGNASAQYNLALLYEDGRGLQQDYAQAAIWYRKAAEQGFASAQCNLGLLYAHGRGVQQDHTQAAAWYRKAAEQGNAVAQFDLGALYAHGDSGSQDHAESAKWYLKAAESCDAANDKSAGYCESMILIGFAYMNGDGVPQDYTQAAKWLRKSAEKGDSLAMESMGWFYAKGYGVPTDAHQAEMWFRKAADQGDTNAKIALEATQRLLALGPSAYQTAIFDGWQTVPSGTYCNTTATATPSPYQNGLVTAYGTTNCSDSSKKVFSITLGQYRYQVAPEYGALAYMPVTWIFYAGKQSPLEKLPPGTEVRVRSDGGFLYMLNAKGKDTKFEIVSVGPR